MQNFIAQPSASLPVPGKVFFPQQEAEALSVLRACLDLLDHGVVVLDTLLRIHHINLLAQRVLGASPVLRLHGDSLAGASSTVTDQLQGKVRNAASGLHTISVLSHQHGSTTLSFAPLSEANETGPLVLMSLPRCPHAHELSITLFARSTGLTRAEEYLLHSVCAGSSSAEIAKARGVSLETVRSQMRTLREKTECSTMRAMVKRVAELPPISSALRLTAPAHGSPQYS